MAILPNLAAENEALRLRIAALEAAQAKPLNRLTLKVTAKKPDGTGTDGAISLYGLGRFPVTLYAGSWERLLDHADTLRAFISANEAVISRKA